MKVAILCIVLFAPAVLTLSPGNVPKALVLIGTFDEYIYWQDTEMRTQSEARTFCGEMAMSMATFPNRAHLDFVISVPATLDGSWTDWTLENTNSMYKWGNGGAISTTIGIDHYEALGLRLQKSTHSVLAGRSNSLHQTICALHLAPESSNSTKGSSKALLIAAAVAQVRQSFPNKGTKAFGMIGQYDGHTYWQEDVVRTQSAARVFCDGLGMTLARFPNKAHLDFASFEGALNGAWTDGISFYERAMFKSSTGSTIPADIPLVHYANLALTIDITTHRLVADLANSHVGATICQLRTAQ